MVGAPPHPLPEAEVPGEGCMSPGQQWGASAGSKSPGSPLRGHLPFLAAPTHSFCDLSGEQALNRSHSHKFASQGQI